MTKFLTITLALLMSSSAFAGSWSAYTTVEDIIIEGADTASGLIITFPAPFNQQPGVTECADRYVYLDASTAKGKLIHSTLLTARVANRKVSVQFAPSCTSLSRGIITGLRL